MRSGFVGEIRGLRGSWAYVVGLRLEWPGLLEYSHRNLGVSPLPTPRCNSHRTSPILESPSTQESLSRSLEAIGFWD
ncbi:hypothetical protein L3X38_037237 [Prunus dulcis]|uniref:Uncharacterized protein n=1 Tax=Prunus dulcis TaxID=3755 RepID=A0AAD4YQG4_PRUDU|nr:hypothetical protein L3X38_037237 [Prunus dulcis]